jgi:hypothetical protein
LKYLYIIHRGCNRPHNACTSYIEDLTATVGMEKTIIMVKAYVLEEPPEGPRRDEKNNY